MGPSKLRNCLFLGKCSKWNLNFQNWSKSLCLGVSEPTKQFAAQSTTYVVRNRHSKEPFVKKKKEKKNEKKKSKFAKL